MKITVERVYRYKPNGELYCARMQITHDLFQKFLEPMDEKQKQDIPYQIYRTSVRTEITIFLDGMLKDSFYLFLKKEDIKFAEKLYKRKVFLELVYA